MNCTLILGGARSGKSRYAEALASKSGREVVYVATGQASGEEMAARIAIHRQRRPATWVTVEEPLALAETLLNLSSPRRVLLVDCLTQWLSNLLLHADDTTGTEQPLIPVPSSPSGSLLALPLRFWQEQGALLAALPQLSAEVLLVSDEVGMGITPDSAFSRRFADEAGLLNQSVAQSSDRVVMLIAGLPLWLKGNPPDAG